ncbi:MAG: S1C family serine protease [Acidimicrobiia bacterium]|nr:S1C family serine protease [Acidimicrobiia bacterium]
MPTLLTELAETTRRIAAAVEPSIVTIGRNARGTGFVLAPGQVLTNAHNLNDRTTSVTFSDGRSAQAELVGADVDGDLVVIAVDTADHAPLPWSATDIRIGDIVFAASLGPAGVRITNGQASNVGRPFRGPRGRRIPGGIEHTARAARGSSGGPLLDVDGGVAGINTRRLGAGFYLARPANAKLIERVTTLAEGTTVERPRLGVAVAGPKVAAKLRSSVGLPERRGLLVRGVDDDSAAERAGIAVGDLLVSAGGVGLDSTDALFDSLDTADDTVLFTIVRGADEIEIPVDLRPAAGEDQA